MKQQFKVIAIAFLVAILVYSYSLNRGATNAFEECDLRQSISTDTKTCHSKENLSFDDQQSLVFDVVTKSNQTSTVRIGFVGKRLETNEKFSILQIELNKNKAGESNALVIVGERSLPTAWQFDVRLSKQELSKIRIELTNRRRIRVWNNGELIHGFKWSIPVTDNFDISSSEIVIDQLSPELSVGMLAKVEVTKQHSDFIQFLSLIAFSILIFYSTVLLSKSKWERSTKISPSVSSYLATFCASATITCMTIIQGILGLLGTHDYFDRNGITYARAARYSDWFQLRELAQFADPYLVGNSQYPPAFLGVFKAFPVIASESGLAIFCIVCPVLIGLVMSRIFDVKDAKIYLLLVMTICISYPYIYALDRGSSELILASLFAVFILFMLRDRLVLAAGILGLMICLKAFPIIFLPLLIRNKQGTKLIAISLGVAVVTTTLGSLVLSGSPIASTIQYIQMSINSNSAVSQARMLTERSTSLFQWTYSILEALSPGLPTTELPKSVAQLTLVLAALILATVAYFYLATKLMLSTKVIVLTITMLLLIPLSYDYRVLWLVPAYAFWLIDNQHSRFKLFHVMAFGALFAARPVSFITDRISIGSILSFPILLSVLIAILYEHLKTLEPKHHQKGKELENS